MVNASLAGVIREARLHSEIDRLFAARFGFPGILRQDLADLSFLADSELDAMALSPASVLGTSRQQLSERDLDQIAANLKARGAGFLFVIGGNGSMGTAARISQHANPGLTVIGIPKTIDNDILEIDHTPGYASAARFFACAVRDIGGDNRTLPGQVEFVEVLGRNVGWLAAATAFARHRPHDPPHLIYFPEAPLPLEQLLDDVNRVYQRLGRCVVAVCEGQLDQNQQPFGADVRVGSGGALAMNLAHRLAMLVSDKLKFRARSEKPGLLGRSTTAFASELDRQEAERCGRAAVQCALSGAQGVMITLIRDSGAGYSVHTGSAPLENVSGRQRAFPRGWMNAAANDVAPGFLEYAAPLIGAIPAYPEVLRSISSS